MQIFQIPSAEQRLTQIIEMIRSHLKDTEGPAHIEQTGRSAAVITPWESQSPILLRSEHGSVIADTAAGEPLLLARENFDRRNGTLTLDVTPNVKLISEGIATYGQRGLPRRQREHAAVESFIRDSPGEVQEYQWFEERAEGQADGLLSVRQGQEILIVPYVVTERSDSYVLSSGETTLGTLAYDPNEAKFSWVFHEHWPPQGTGNAAASLRELTS